MPKKQSSEHPQLFAIAPVEKPSVLSGVGDRAPKSVNAAPPPANVKEFPQQFGRPDAQPPLDESAWASRSSRERRGGRYHPELLQKTDIELRKLDNGRGRDWQDFVDRAMQIWLDAGAPELGVWATTCSSCGCSDQDNIKTTTTTAVARSLPGFPAELLEIPNKSRHSPQVLWCYAQSSYHEEISGYEGIKRPVFWVKSAIRTGSHDVMVDSWKKVKQRIEEETERRTKTKAAEAERLRLQVEEIKRERAERLNEK